MEDKIFVKNDDERKFLENCAIAAMQGIQESSSKMMSEMSDMFVDLTATMAFNLADAMLNEYRRRVSEIK